MTGNHTSDKTSLSIIIAANNGDIGGGEVMQLALAKELLGLGHTVHIVGPASPSGLVSHAKALGFGATGLECKTRKGYMLSLRHWARRQEYDLFWCNGLVPSAATAGLPRRIVHLHWWVDGPKRMVFWIARLRALATLVPSEFMAGKIPGSQVLHNWVEQVSSSEAKSGSTQGFSVGFLGRPSVAKGTDLLARAIQLLEQQNPGEYHLTVAGEPRFVDDNSWSTVQLALAEISRNMTMAGWVAPSDLFSQIDVLVCPSAVPEPFGLVVAEAMSARVPVIVSDAGALPEVIGPDHPWIARAGDAAALAEAIKSVRTSASVSETVEHSYTRWNEMWSPKAGRARLQKLLIQLNLENTDHARSRYEKS